MKRVIRVTKQNGLWWVVVYRPRLCGLVSGHTVVSREKYPSIGMARSVAYRIIEYRRYTSNRPSKFKMHYEREVDFRTVGDLMARPKLYAMHVRWTNWRHHVRYRIGVSMHLPVSELLRRK
jgi:hypothetical protein